MKDFKIWSGDALLIVLRRANVTSVTGCSRSSGSVRITIPSFVAATLNLGPGDLVLWELHEGEGVFYVTLKPIRGASIGVR